MVLNTKAKRSKGSVSLVSNNGSLKLAWRFDSRRFYLSPGLKDSDINRKSAQKIATQIELDILSGNFDESLEKYRVGSKNGSKRLEPTEKVVKPINGRFLALWLAYVADTKPGDRAKAVHYQPITNWLEKVNPTTEQLSTKLLKYGESVGSYAFNERLTYLTSAIKWGIDEGLIASNPLKGIKKRTNKGAGKETRKPFTSEEIERILDALWNDRFCPTKSAFKHSHYAPFIEFLMITGCRPAELIGLQWKHIDFKRKEIEISSVLARSNDGKSTAKHRVRKETKTGSIRYLPMSERMIEILTNLSGSKDSNTLVFTSPKGLALDDRNIRRRVWKPILEKLEIEYRVPYAARHSMASRAIEQGVPLTGIAYLMGHSSTRMVMENYGHMITRPELPSL